MHRWGLEYTPDVTQYYEGNVEYFLLTEKIPKLVDIVLFDVCFVSLGWYKDMLNHQI